MTHPQLYQSAHCFPCDFHSYGKAAFCLEELMMTNPHNHLYCEQYAEVGTRLFVRHQHGGKLWNEFYLTVNGASL